MIENQSIITKIWNNQSQVMDLEYLMQSIERAWFILFAKMEFNNLLPISMEVFHKIISPIEKFSHQPEISFKI